MKSYTYIPTDNVTPCTFKSIYTITHGQYDSSFMLALVGANVYILYILCETCKLWFIIPYNWKGGVQDIGQSALRQFEG